jgi:hypothetical protein
MSVAQLRAGYRFKDLKEARIVSSRGDLSRKQRLHGFPLPVKTSDRCAWWGSDVIDAWLQTRAALRTRRSRGQASQESPALFQSALAGQKDRQAPSAPGRRARYRLNSKTPAYAGVRISRGRQVARACPSNARFGSIPNASIDLTG